MKTKTKKTFDAVAMMRDLRTRVNDQIKDMSFEQQRLFLSQKVKFKSPAKNSAETSPLQKTA